MKSYPYHCRGFSTGPEHSSFCRVALLGRLLPSCYLKDKLCSLQVETIGDAYCVAGGLHRESDTHAVQIALMALKMMELSNEVMSPHGEPIKVRQWQMAD